jgi:acetolactate synthase I/II/III large subunit
MKNMPRRTDPAAIAKGFGLRGTTVTEVKQFKPLYEAYAAQDTAELWNVHISDKVANPSIQRQMKRGHSKM